LHEGACCCVDATSENAGKLVLDGCAGIVVMPPSPLPADSRFHTWLNTTLPIGVRGVYVYGELGGQPLPEVFGKGKDTLEALLLYGRGFVGTLPSAWAELSSLRVIIVENNNLTGTLPPSWSALTGLVDLSLSNIKAADAGGNAFEGPLPAEWSASTQLKPLDCYSGACENISGPFPTSWGALCGLKEFSLYDPEGVTHVCAVGHGL
jgi:hypothetical protein